jgi:hypothetical protein
MFIGHTRDLALPLPCLPRAGIGSDQRLGLVGRRKISTERRLRVGRVSAKIPTSRKEREKWGTRNSLIVDNWSAAFVTLINLVLA